jgi:hypothetical protein
MAADISTPGAAAWTRWYWPSALALGVFGWLAVDLWAPQHRGVALAIAAALILVPEITVIMLHRSQDTFSDWTWHVLHVTRNQPLGNWSAEHFLALLVYVVIAVRVLAFMWSHSGYWLAGAATAVALWLFRHLFWGNWR